ncbi:hypothetical protein AURDEDRAFT_176176 [Auricularia subglabra TFB-10046 SS5]|uniref:Uncharacterized protein n=1 Tax=Auricularia subglabra (strain TFB-10046 / SS5) TaxID=717982 RepID=J0WQG3_AURST|nr:hypothetical protein AURDEDRAFT_176176 [Auricularia subglabra TFB-10046 SS5]
MCRKDGPYWDTSTRRPGSPDQLMPFGWWNSDQLARTGLAYLAWVLWTARARGAAAVSPAGRQRGLRPYLNTRSASAWSGPAPRRTGRPPEVRLAQYCSRGGLEHPHKEICDMLQEPFVFTALGETGEAFSAACAENDFPLERVDRLIAWSGGTAQDYAHGAPSIECLTPETIVTSELIQADYTVFRRDRDRRNTAV